MLGRDGIAGQKLPSSLFNFICGSVSTQDIGDIKLDGKENYWGKEKEEGFSVLVFPISPLSFSCFVLVFLTVFVFSS